MPPIDDLARLHHILDAGLKAASFVKGKKRSELDENELLSLALLRLLEITGEAARGLSPVIQNRYPEIPWQQMAGMRNRLIHGYFDVDPDMIWQTVTAELPPLIEQIEHIIEKEQGNSPADSA
jgi:uncharacterized protein with HEPN domain